MSSENSVVRFCQMALASSTGPLAGGGRAHVLGQARLVGGARLDLEGHEALHVDHPQVGGMGVRPHLVDELRHRPCVGGAADAVDAGVEGLQAGLLLEVGGLVAHRARAAEDDEVRRLLERLDAVGLDRAVGGGHGREEVRADRAVGVGDDVEREDAGHDERGDEHQRQDEEERPSAGGLVDLRRVRDDPLLELAGRRRGRLDGRLLGGAVRVAGLAGQAGAALRGRPDGAGVGSSGGVMASVSGENGERYARGRRIPQGRAGGPPGFARPPPGSGSRAAASRLLEALLHPPQTEEAIDDR